jgi:hypothetical protein
MNKFFRISFLTLIILGNIACTSGSSPKRGEQSSSFETGIVIPKVSCIKDPSTTYSLYLPKNYSSSHRFPLILAFDPGGSGILPLTMYHDLAEKYGYIMMGSNDSKNGNSFPQTNLIISTLLEEIPERFSIDSNRIYTMGFSGGARIASLIGLYIGGIASVTGCGAGFPSTDRPGKYVFDYIGFAGMSDFNMYELIRLDQQLSQQNFNHVLFLFDGIHEWPQKLMMEKAFQWNECSAMRKQLIPRNEKLLGTLKESFDSILKKDQGTGDKIVYHQDLANTISFMKDLMEINSYKQLISDLEKSPDYKKQSGNQQKLMDRELKEQQTFSEDFFFKDLTWWKEKIAKYDSRIKAGKNISDVRMCKRIKSYLSLLAYMSYTRMHSSGNKEKADFALQVYQIVDPENAAKIK